MNTFEASFFVWAPNKKFKLIFFTTFTHFQATLVLTLWEFSFVLQMTSPGTSVNLPISFFQLLFEPFVSHYLVGFRWIAFHRKPPPESLARHRSMSCQNGDRCLVCASKRTTAHPATTWTCEFLWLALNIRLTVWDLN